MDLREDVHYAAGTVTAPRDPSLTERPTPGKRLSSDPTDEECTPRPTICTTTTRRPVGTGCTLGITGGNPCYVAYDPASRRRPLIADFTNDRGDAVKNLIRIERGTINRSLYGSSPTTIPLAVGSVGAAEAERQGDVEMGAGTSANRYESRRGPHSTRTLCRGFMSSHTHTNTRRTTRAAGAETIMM